MALTKLEKMLVVWALLHLVKTVLKLHRWSYPQANDRNWILQSQADISIGDITVLHRPLPLS
jgi:hypothetical protein